MKKLDDLNIDQLIADTTALLNQSGPADAETTTQGDQDPAAEQSAERRIYSADAFTQTDQREAPLLVESNIQTDEVEIPKTVDASTQTEAQTASGNDVDSIERLQREIEMLQVSLAAQKEINNALREHIRQSSTSEPQQKKNSPSTLIVTTFDYQKKIKGFNFTEVSKSELEHLQQQYNWLSKKNHTEVDESLLLVKTEPHSDKHKLWVLSSGLDRLMREYDKLHNQSTEKAQASRRSSPENLTPTSAYSESSASAAASATALPPSPSPSPTSAPESLLPKAPMPSASSIRAASVAAAAAQSHDNASSPAAENMPFCPPEYLFDDKCYQETLGLLAKLKKGKGDKDEQALTQQIEDLIGMLREDLIKAEAAFNHREGRTEDGHKRKACNTQLTQLTRMLESKKLSAVDDQTLDKVHLNLQNGSLSASLQKFFADHNGNPMAGLKKAESQRARCNQGTTVAESVSTVR